MRERENNLKVDFINFHRRIFFRKSINSWEFYTHLSLRPLKAYNNREKNNSNKLVLFLPEDLSINVPSRTIVSIKIYCAITDFKIPRSVSNKMPVRAGIFKRVSYFCLNKYVYKMPSPCSTMKTIYLWDIKK